MYKKGNEELLTKDYRRVAIIGPRDSRTKDRIRAYEFAQNNCLYGNVVVSGLAYGIDTFAHTGAIERTIAVVNNMENPYPKENRRLIRDILDNNGLIISPFKYDLDGSRAFLIRDDMIVDISDKIYYFGDESGGTGYTVTAARRKGKPVERIE